MGIGFDLTSSSLPNCYICWFNLLQYTLSLSLYDVINEQIFSFEKIQALMGQIQYGLTY